MELTRAAYYLLAVLALALGTTQGVLQQDEFQLEKHLSRHHDVRLHCSHYPDWVIADEGDVLQFHSPNYPRLYPHSSKCAWAIKGKNEGIYFRISCDVFEMESPSNSKCKDFLSITDGNKEPQRFCGSEWPSITTGHKVNMKFQSNYRRQYIGFSCTATSYLNETWSANHPNIPERCNADPADVDKKDAKGMTALINNARDRDIGCVHALIQANADVNLKGGKTAVTALIMAARSGCAECITLLTDAGANMAFKDRRYGLTALMSACKNQQVGCVRNLVAAGVHVNQTTHPEGISALAYASGFSCPECVKLLLDAGANVNNKDEWHKTALMAAARADCTSCVEKIIAANATLNNKNDEGRTALIYASRDGHPDSVRLLIQAGAAVNIIDKHNHNALWHAQRWPCRPACIALLKAAGAKGPDVDPLNCAQDVFNNK